MLHQKIKMTSNVGGTWSFSLFGGISKMTMLHQNFLGLNLLFIFLNFHPPGNQKQEKLRTLFVFWWSMVILGQLGGTGSFVIFWWNMVIFVFRWSMVVSKILVKHGHFSNSGGTLDFWARLSAIKSFLKKLTCSNKI